MSDASDSNATQHVTRESDEIEGLADTVQSFLAAFAALDWEPFRRSFADDATIFFPLSDHPQRAKGREEIERLFRGVFERARADSPNGPPYLALQPHDLSIRRMGDMGDMGESACVTFHLHDPGVLCRRTLILCHGAEGWKIVHLHASNLPAPDRDPDPDPERATAAPAAVATFTRNIHPQHSPASRPLPLVQQRPQVRPDNICLTFPSTAFANTEAQTAIERD